MPVVLADLRDRRIRADLSEAGAGAVAGPLYPILTGGSRGALTDTPLRVLIVLPIDERLAGDAEALALALLGVDPEPHAIVVVVQEDADGGPERDAAPIDRTLPSEFGRQPGVRFLDLRASMLSIGHPRTGAERVGTGARDPWVGEFVRDLLSELIDRNVFDAVWASVPQDRPATVGMRVASLGTGRHLAVADLALRLADELRPDREPDMGHRLPERWHVEPGLLPDGGSAVADRLKVPDPARSIVGLAEVPRHSVINALRRGPAMYHTAVSEATSAMAHRPAFLADLFERAESRRNEPGGPFIDPVGAADLDRELGGIIFGDPIARASEEGDDPAARVGELLEDAANRQADGLSAAVLAAWLRADADRVEPMGPAAFAARLREDTQPWASLHRSIDRPTDDPAASSPRRWISAAMGNRLGATRSPDGEAADPPPTPADHPRAWAIPTRLGLFLGSAIWRRRSLRFLFLMIATLLLVGAVAQFVADATGLYVLRSADLGLDAATADLVQMAVTLLAILMFAYLGISLLVGSAVRRWANSFRFAEVPAALRQIEVQARAAAVAEVARCPVRRDYCRVARAAADTLEMATTEGSKIAREFGTRTKDEVVASEVGRPVPPYRDVVGSSRAVAGTDAGGIYRIYPLYVSTLRSMFAASLVDAVRERWPRIRGVFWDETSAAITTLASASLEERLTRLRRSGIQRGELLRDGVDPADELAEQLWTDPSIREAALRALHFNPEDPMPLLATPGDARQLDGTVDGELILAIPATLEPLVRERAMLNGAHIVVTNTLETATALRVFPFRAGLYDFVDSARSQEASPR